MGDGSRLLREHTLAAATMDDAAQVEPNGCAKFVHKVVLFCGVFTLTLTFVHHKSFTLSCLALVFGQSKGQEENVK